MSERKRETESEIGRERDRERRLIHLEIACIP